jgi:hypothetical protein
MLQKKYHKRLAVGKFFSDICIADNSGTRGNRMAKGSPASRPRGRPSLPPEQVKRYALGIRTTKQIKDLLQTAADSSGRSVAHEIELRLERSFDEEKSLGGPRLAAVFRSLAATAEFLSDRREWLSDYRLFNIVIDAWHRDLLALRPEEPQEITDFMAALGDLPPDIARVQLKLLALNKGLSEERRREIEAKIVALPGRR